MKVVRAGQVISFILALMMGCGFASPSVWAPFTSLQVSEPDVSTLSALPNTTLTYYDVPGTDARAIRTYMDEHGAVDPNDGTINDAVTDWYIRWRWPVVNGVCNLAEVEMTFSGDVVLPRLSEADRLSQADRDDWNRYMTALIAHEADHLRHAYENMEDVAAAIRGASCEDANDAGAAAIRVLTQFDIDYDRETQHGITQGAVFPAR